VEIKTLNTMKKKNSKALLMKIAFRFDPITSLTKCDTCQSIVHIDDNHQPFKKENGEIGIDCFLCFTKGVVDNSQ
jgi:hypothetical protein